MLDQGLGAEGNTEPGDTEHRQIIGPVTNRNQGLDVTRIAFREVLARKPGSGVIRIEVLPSFVCDPAQPVDADLHRLRAEMQRVFDAPGSALRA